MGVFYWATIGLFVLLLLVVATIMVIEGVRLVDHDRLSIPQSLMAVCIATSMHFMYALTLPTVARDMRKKSRGLMTFGFDDTPFDVKKAQRDYAKGDIDLVEFEERIENELSDDHESRRD